MAKRNQRSKVVTDRYIMCGGPNGIIVSRSPRFKESKPHTTGGLCPNCKPKFEQNVERLMAGGIMIVCTTCHAVTVEMEVPEKLKSLVTQMPDGTKRLEVAECPLCTKEAVNGTQDTKAGS